MTSQGAFNTVYRHLLTQKRPAVYYTDVCLYRTPTGLKCAIGCLIPDTLYSSEFERKNVHTLIKNYPQIQKLFEGCDSKLLQNLQDIHDCWGPDLWKERLERIRIKYNLTQPD